MIQIDVDVQCHKNSLQFKLKNFVISKMNLLHQSKKLIQTSPNSKITDMDRKK